MNADEGHLDLPGMSERLANTSRRGRIYNKDSICLINYEEYKDQPIETIRRTLNIVPKDKDINSQGGWHPDRIT